jgi:hypothetical protein
LRLTESELACIFKARLRYSTNIFGVRRRRI